MTAPGGKGGPSATLEDLLAIPEGERRHELIDGEIVEKGAATGEHGAVQRKLAAWIDPLDRKLSGRGLGGWWFALGVELYFDARHTFCPDLVGWRRERVPAQPRGTPVYERPDWICEILSTNRRNDLIRKKRVYHRHAVPHCWIIDPTEQTLTVYRWAPDGYIEVLIAERGEQVRPEPFEALPLAVGALFGDDEEESVAGS